MGLSIWQILIVVAIIAIFFGYNRLPGLGKSLGQAIRGFKQGITDDEIDVTDSAKSEKMNESQAQNVENSEELEKNKS